MNIDLKYRQFIPEARRIVVKIGTRVIAQKTGRPDLPQMRRLAAQVSALHRAGYQVVLVSSGAIGAGMAALGIATRPKEVPDLQMCAAVGQARLMALYEELFQSSKIRIGQVLLTHDDFENRIRHSNARRTMEHLLRNGVIPIINENDTVATDEIAVGDNDTLGAIVSVNVGADLLVMLTDIDGLYTADPHTDGSARILHEVAAITPEIRALGGGSVSGLGTGGMATKLGAAERCVNAGIDVVIANGAEPQNLYAIVEGKPVGTRFLGAKG